MSKRYLFGPVTPAYADQCLRRQRQDGACLAFGTGGTDLTIGPGDSWDAVLGRLPAGWRPDFVALYLPYTSVPGCLWSAPLPVVGLAADYNLLWHYYRRCLPRCDLVLTDAAGVEALGRIGIGHARQAVLYGCDRDYLEQPYPEGPRDIDVLFVGNLHPAVQRERLPWLARLARLSEQYRVVIRTGVFGPAYRDLLGRARVIFNRSIRGECNRRAFEAAAAGALLFQEAGNREIDAYLREGFEYVAYTDANLEARLEHYLAHEDERAALARAAHARVARYSFEHLWEAELLPRVEAEWEQMRVRSRVRREDADRRPTSEVSETSEVFADPLSARLWETVGSTGGVDPGLVPDLAAALLTQPHSAALHNALGLAVTVAARGQGLTTAPMAEQAAGYFRRAVEADPGHVVAALNLVEALVGAEQKDGAIRQARRTLAVLEDWCTRSASAAPAHSRSECTAASSGQPAGVWDSPHFPPAFDHFRVEWERAAWANAGNAAAEVRAKCALVRWRLHTLLADLTGDLGHAYEAALARPDLPVSRERLARALGRAGRHAEAVRHLYEAAAGNPFDLETGVALFDALGAAGDGDGQRRVAREYRLRSQAAPQAIPMDNGFRNVPPVGDELASVIIPCHNQLPFTRGCLESLFRFTRGPYELIVVDNGSTDGTAEYLADLQARAAEQPGLVRLELIRNPENRGFPAACNQALAAARGRYVVFLNNDTVLTEGYLDGLIARALYDWPQVGMVGPVTNYTAAPQQVAVDYTDVSGLAAFAARRRREYAGKVIDCPRLTGF